MKPQRNAVRARVSHWRLGIMLTLLLGTNLAIVDGYDEQDSARCDCEGEPAETGGIFFFLAGQIVGKLELREGEIFDLQVRQEVRAAGDVFWEKGGDGHGLASIGPLTAGQGEETSFQVRASQTFSSSRELMLPRITVRVTADDTTGNPRRTKRLAIEAVFPKPQAHIVQSDASTTLDLLSFQALPGSAAETGSFWVSILNSNGPRNWELDVATYGLSFSYLKGLEVTAVTKLAANLFKVDYEFDPAEHVTRPVALRCANPEPRFCKVSGLLTVTAQDPLKDGTFRSEIPVVILSPRDSP